MTRVILLRHGHVEGIKPHKFRGQLDYDLTKIGQQQARQTAHLIQARWSPDAIYSSPLKRCLETAAEISSLFALKVTPIADLTDIDYGYWQGLTVEEVQASWKGLLDAWYRAPQTIAFPKGESLGEVEGRALRAFHRLLDKHPEETIVVVGHDSINRIILLTMLGLPLSRYWLLSLAPCGVTYFEYQENQLTIRSINETAHLQ